MDLMETKLHWRYREQGILLIFILLRVLELSPSGSE